MNQQFRIKIERDDTCARRARRFVSQRLEGIATEEQLNTAVLLTSELVTNAYLHGEGRIDLRLGVHGRDALIEVCDQGSGEAVKLVPEPPKGGWGLRLVDRLAAEWGVFDGTTHVWAKVSLD